MRSKAISSGEKKINLNVSKHFKTENFLLNESAVTTLTFKVPRIVEHEVKLPSKIRPNRKNFRMLKSEKKFQNLEAKKSGLL